MPILNYIAAEGTNPYENLALETALLESVKEEQCILYLWQNRRTVVIGRNQNALAECRSAQLEKDGGFLARRFSGGGAVFHDLGNLNFSFIADRRYYDVERQMDILLKAIGKLGICGEKSGRNDAVIDGKKFSGNAFSKKGERCCHHGTIMLHVDKEMISKYLNVSEQKLSSKGVASVKSRVCNLIDHCPDVTVERMKAAMTEAFGEVWGSEPVLLKSEEVDRGRQEELTNLLSSWEWRFGRRIPVSFECTNRFSWGDLTMLMEIQKGRIMDVVFYSDAIDSELVPELAEKLKGCRFVQEEIASFAGTMEGKDDLQNRMLRDIHDWILSLEL